MRKLLNLLRALVAVVRDEREGVPVGSKGPAGPLFCCRLPNLDRQFKSRFVSSTFLGTQVGTFAARLA